MIAHLVSDTSLMVYCTPQDLQSAQITPETLTHPQAIQLVRGVLDGTPLTIDDLLEIQVYPESCGLLLFAYFSPSTPHWFFSHSLEPFIMAAHTVTEPPEDTALYWWNEGYWLQIPATATQLRHRLTEFSMPCHSPIALEGHLSEYGTPICTDCALTTLTYHFPV